jgi:hypothetical protein
MRRAVVVVLWACACWATGPAAAARSLLLPNGAETGLAAPLLRPCNTGPLRLRGGDDDDEPQEINGLRPEPEEEEDGARVVFHEKKLDLLEKIKSGEIKPSAELLARKKDKDSYDKVCCQPLHPQPRLLLAALHCRIADTLGSAF